MYADAILDVLDPERKIFYKRIYRDKCLKASIPSPANHPLQDLLPNNGGNTDGNMVLSKNSESYFKDESISEHTVH